MDNFREWLSDNLRYFMLGGAILVIVAVLFFGIRACVGSGKGTSDEEPNTVQDNSQGNDPSSPEDDGEANDGKKEEDTFAQGRAEQDEEARKQIYADLQAAIQDTAAFYPICSNNKILLISNRIQGVEEAGLVPVYTFEDTYYLSEAV